MYKDPNPPAVSLRTPLGLDPFRAARRKDRSFSGQRGLDEFSKHIFQMKELLLCGMKRGSEFFL